MAFTAAIIIIFFGKIVDVFERRKRGPSNRNRKKNKP